MRWISCSVRPELAWILILFSLPVALSLAETCRIPFASMSKVTSIWGRPRGAGGMSVRLNWPRLLLPRAISRSPWSTWMVTAVWLSSPVENTCCRFVGIDVLPRLATEELLDPVLHLQHAGLTAHQDHVGNVARLDAGVLDRGPARLDRLLDQVLDQALELGARHLDCEMLGPRLVGGDVGQIDLGLRAGGELDLG